MKILGQTGFGGYIVEVQDTELSKIAGANLNHSQLRVGSEVEVSASYEDLRRFRQAEQSIKGAAKTLRAVADLAETASASYLLPPAEDPQPTNPQ